jgi:hypothetical protein
MRRLAGVLRRAGYGVVNVGYPSRRAPVGRLADEAVGAHVAAALRAEPERLHFVTHSLGGILVRHWAGRHPLPAGSRAVMLAPPHGGSEAADRLRHVPPLRWWCGPAMDELGTGAESVPARLGPITLETGVIAGSRNYLPFFERFYDGDSDGIVAVERARVAGMADFVVVPRGHTFIMRAPETARQTLHFLRHGRFDHAAETARS